jgi:hypothetical protein
VSVVGFECRVALAFEVADDDVTHDRLVVDDEDGCHVLDSRRSEVTSV